MEPEIFGNLQALDMEQIDISGYMDAANADMDAAIQDLEPRQEQELNKNNNNMASAGLIQGGVQMLGEASMNLGRSLTGGKARRAEQGRANREAAIMRQRYMSMDTSNPYANLTSPYEN